MSRQSTAPPSSFPYAYPDHRLSASKSFDDGLDDDNLDDSKIASALKYVERILSNAADRLFTSLFPEPFPLVLWIVTISMSISRLSVRKRMFVRYLAV